MRKITQAYLDWAVKNGFLVEWPDAYRLPGDKPEPEQECGCTRLSRQRRITPSSDPPQLASADTGEAP